MSLYSKGIFFFDAHPPLGKQLLYLAGRAAGYDGNFTFDRIGSPYSDNVPIGALRLVPAVAGSLLVPASYKLMLEMCTYHWTAVLAALLVLFGKYLSNLKQLICFSVKTQFICMTMCLPQDKTSESDISSNSLDIQYITVLIQ